MSWQGPPAVTESTVYGNSLLPDWLRPLTEVCTQARVNDLTGFVPPVGANPRHASVLVLFGGANEADGHVLLLERGHDLRSHAGQVAFPGGAQDAEDADAVATALREAAEETGVDPAGVTVIGALPSLWLPPSNFAVTAVVGWWHAPTHVYAADPAETASVHTVALTDLLDPSSRVSVRHPSGYVGPAFLIGDLVVWGFTAGLLARLFALAGWEVPWDAARIVDSPALLAPAAAAVPVASSHADRRPTTGSHR